MWNYRLKKWGARFVGLIVSVIGIVALARYGSGSRDWFSELIVFYVVFGSLAVYYAIRPLDWLPPADGFRLEPGEVLVRSSEWQEEVVANEHTIRAAMLTSLPVEYSRVHIFTVDDRVLVAHRDRCGWSFRRGGVDERADEIALRHFNGPPPEPVKFRWYKVFSRSMSGDTFGNLDAEAVLIAFATGQPKPGFITWRKIERD